MKPVASSLSRSLRSSRGAFTRTDFLITAATVVVLAAMVFVPLTNARNKSRLRVCSANLQKVARAILNFAEDRGRTLPGLIRTDSGDPWWWYKEEVKGYLGLSGPSSPKDQVFACPMDRGYSDP